MKDSGRKKTECWFSVNAVIIALLLAPSLLLASEQPSEQPNQRLRLAELANFVVQDCGSCHGMTLKGGLGPPLLPENLGHLPEEAIAAIIREGIPGTAMPPWKPLLAPVDIDWISHQLKTGALVLP